MVRAIMEGRKTETRRLQGLEELNDDPDQNKVIEDFGTWWECPLVWDDTQCVRISKKHYPGDEIWVKETYATATEPEHAWGPLYRADNDADTARVEKWKPSIFMPRKLSRITLRVTGERIERLQAITEEGAIAEGIKMFTKDGVLMKFCAGDHGEPGNVPWADMPRSARDAYAALWDSINPKTPWSFNPWVRVIQFEKA